MNTLTQDIKALSEQCFAIEDKLPRLYRGIEETNESRVRLELYNIRCKIGSIQEFIKQNDAQYS